MKRNFIRCSTRSSLITLLLSIIVLVCTTGGPQMAWAHSSGMSGYSGNPATNSGAICTACHSGGATPTVTLAGPTSLAPSSSGVYTLTITGGAAVDGGLDVSTTAGTLQATGSNTKLLSGEVTQTSAISFTSGSLVFTFTLVAPPSAGSLTLYAAGLSANGSGSGGDNAARATLAVTVTAPAPQIVVTDSVAPTTDHLIPFGTITDGNTSDQTVTVSNTGSADLVVGTIASVNPLAAPFTIQTNNCTAPVAPGGSCTLTVRFAPVTVNSFSDSFDIPSNDTATGTVTMSVTGTGTATPVPVITVTDSAGSTTDHQIPFGTVLDNLISDQTVTISNTGSADLVIGTIASANPLAAPFSIQTDNCSSQTIAPGGSCTLIVRFAPLAAGSYSDAFDIPSNDAATGTVTMSVSGTGKTPVPVIVVTDSVAPTTDHQIPFGTVLDGLTSDKTVTISNTGSADLSVGTIAGPAAPFSIQSNNCTSPIAPGGSCTLTVRFAPVTAAVFNDTFDIPSNDTVTGTVTMSVSGTGTATPVPVITVTDSVNPNNDLSIPFGSVVHGTTSDQTVTVSNTGTADLTIYTIASANPLAAPFSITTNNCSNKTIAPGGSCTLTVRFAPTATGPFSDSFDIPSDDPSTPTVTVSVSGTGWNNLPTAPTLVSPSDGATGVGTTTTLKWTKSTDPDNDPLTYHLYYCPGDPSASCTPVDVATNGMTGIYFAGSGLLFVGFVFARSGRTRKLILMPLISLLLMTGALFTSCGNSGGVSSTPTSGMAITHQVSGLTSTTTYYWKVVAVDGQGGLASSPTWSFTTQ
jgi:hypothetical protein